MTRLVRRTLARCAVAAIAVAVLAPGASAQSGPSGGLNGRIVVQSRAAVPGAA